jgi:hypothetical protein
MSISDAFSTLMKIRRVVAIISIIAGAGYKVAPMVWHKAEAKHELTAAATTTTTNSVATKPATDDRDLGVISLTNHYETCVSLGAGKDCILTPKMLDSRNVQLTLAVESKTAAGKIHDLSVTQIVTASGKPFEVAVGDFSLSLTPNVTSE